MDLGQVGRLATSELTNGCLITQKLSCALSMTCQCIVLLEDKHVSISSVDH